MRVEISLAAMVLLAGCYEIDNGVRLNKLTGGTCIVDAVRPGDREQACEGTQRPETLAMWKRLDEEAACRADAACAAAVLAKTKRDLDSLEERNRKLFMASQAREAEAMKKREERLKRSSYDEQKTN